MRIAVTSGYRYSLHSTALLAMLGRQGFEAVVCLNVSMLNWKRFKYYLARLGPKKLFQSWKTRVWDRNGKKDLHPEVRYISDYLKQEGINYLDLKAICRDSGCRFATVRSLNCDKALSILRKAKIDLVVYMGGGILRPSFISVPRIGVLNSHGGPLPHFRRNECSRMVNATRYPAGCDRPLHRPRNRHWPDTLLSRFAYPGNRYYPRCTWQDGRPLSGDALERCRNGGIQSAPIDASRPRRWPSVLRDDSSTPGEGSEANCCSGSVLVRS